MLNNANYYFFKSWYYKNLLNLFFFFSCLYSYSLIYESFNKKKKNRFINFQESNKSYLVLNNQIIDTKLTLHSKLIGIVDIQVHHTRWNVIDCRINTFALVYIIIVQRFKLLISYCNSRIQWKLLCWLYKSKINKKRNVVAIYIYLWKKKKKFIITFWC